MEVGRFPDIVLDPSDGSLHMVYLIRDGTSSGLIRYAHRTATGTTFTDVTTLDDFTVGSAGARDIATVALDSSGEPVVAIQNRSELILATGGDARFQLESFPAAAGLALRQQTSIGVTHGDQIHVIFWLEDGSDDLVCHGTGS